MFFSKFFLTIILIMNKTIQYYKLKYGRLVLNYYDNENCLNNINETIEYPISNDEDENELLVLNGLKIKPIKNSLYNILLTKII